MKPVGYFRNEIKMVNKNLSPAKQALLEKWLHGQFNDDAPGIPKRPLNSKTPLSFPQQRQLFLELLEQSTAVNNLSISLELKGKIDISSLEQSANKIIARHDSLRTRFSFGIGLPIPEVLSDIKISIPVIDLQQLDFSEQVSEARRLAEKEVLQPFDLTKSPLMRLKLYLLNKEKYWLLLIVHHTIADGWSLGVFLRELMFFYGEITSGKNTQLPELPIQYADYAYWQTNNIREEVLSTSLTFWKKQLSGELPNLELPTDYMRGARQTFSGGTYRFVLPKEFMESLDRLSREEDVTLFMILLTSFFILLHRYSGQDDILIGTPVANRNRPELENLIGVFINTIVLRAHIPGDLNFRELLQRIRNVCLNAYAHQDLPFEKLVEELKPRRDLSRTPLFQAVFNMQNSPMPVLETPGLRIGLMDIDRGVSQFDLTLIMSVSEKQCQGIVEYNRDLFEPATIIRMFQSFQMLLKDAITHPETPVSRLQLITKEEQHRIVNELNQTKLDFPREKCLHQLFEAQVEQTPVAVALIQDDITITYFELNRRANVLAGHLQTLGVGPGARVGIFMEKSFEIVEALLAVLKAGGTYVPINTSFPVERVQFILNDANVGVLLTNVDPGPLGNINVQVINFNDKIPPTKTVCSNPQTNISPEDLAYIIYTSGSTGQPKGVKVNHCALVNFLWSMSIEPGIIKGDLLLTVTPISFDIAALELFLPLIVGATVVIVNNETTTNPFMLAQAINQYHVNIIQATPATWQLLIESGWPGEPGLKALCGGDVLTRKLANQLLDRVDNLWNMYGPTETTIWSSLSQIKKDEGPVTIGKPIGNTQLYILDAYLQPVPIGVPGELHIGGEGLANGYLNQPHLTSEKFIPDHFSYTTGARLYKTGDRASYLSDHSIEILGRIDYQVKIHGHRIELGEIETVLMQHPSIHEAIVITRTKTSGEKVLVAYFVPMNGKSPDAGELRDFIRKKLPAYLIPVGFISVVSLPLTSNGKIDRKALSVTEDIRLTPGYVAPRNKVEQILASIWQDVLSIEQVGIHDNFFDLGGASIQSLQVVAHANIAGFRLSAESIFEYQTIAGLAAQITEQ
jgi:amino acid adenylation domain-containing protein